MQRNIKARSTRHFTWSRGIVNSGQLLHLSESEAQKLMQEGKIKPVALPNREGVAAAKANPSAGGQTGPAKPPLSLPPVRVQKRKKPKKRKAAAKA